MANVRTISTLPETSECPDAACLEISLPSEQETITTPEGLATTVTRYSSRKITYGNFYAFLSSDLMDQIDYRNHLSNINVDELNRRVTDLSCNNVTIRGTKAFTHALSVADGSFSRPKDSVNVSMLQQYVSENNTVYVGEDTGIEDDAILVDTGASAENQYRMQVEGNTSNEIVAAKTGTFSCYGWLDEIENTAINNASRWVALEGYINGRGWVILQLQPFISNLFLSYVSFTFPVKAGLKMRIKTGFMVGTNSDKYSQADGSLAFKAANTFVGTIYYNT